MIITCVLFNILTERFSISILNKLDFFFSLLNIYIGRLLPKKKKKRTTSEFKQAEVKLTEEYRSIFQSVSVSSMAANPIITLMSLVELKGLGGLLKTYSEISHVPRMSCTE